MLTRILWQGLGLLLAPPTCWGCGQRMEISTFVGCCHRCLAHCPRAEPPWGLLEAIGGTVPYFAPLLYQLPVRTLLQQWHTSDHSAWQRYMLGWWHMLAQAHPCVPSWLAQASQLTCLFDPHQSDGQPPMRIERWARSLAKSYRLPFVPLAQLLEQRAVLQAKPQQPCLVLTPVLNLYDGPAYVQLQAKLQTNLYLLAMAQQSYCPNPAEALPSSTRS